MPQVDDFSTVEFALIGVDSEIALVETLEDSVETTIVITLIDTSNEDVVDGAGDFVDAMEGLFDNTLKCIPGIGEAHGNSIVLEYAILSDRSGEGTAVFV